MGKPPTLWAEILYGQLLGKAACTFLVNLGYLVNNPHKFPNSLAYTFAVSIFQKAIRDCDVEHETLLWRVRYK
jgi:hypothetical protein